MPSLADLARGFSHLDGRNRLGAMVAAALAIALAVSAWMWSATPEYRVLFSNVSDRDGGAIVAALSQQNVPYRMSEGGAAILVPAAQVHDVRLRLASQGLPRGGTVGFELMDSQKFGATQFQEQVNYQRALEGELARSIQSLAALASARVHLAIPKPSVFLREQAKPSASVIVTLHPGRTLERAQVAGIAHLISSSVPELKPRAVSILDQHGNLLSAGHDAPGGLDAGQLTYVQTVEATLVKRILDILEPIAGQANVRARVAAELDFSQAESTTETFRPNQQPDAAVVRSEQKTESSEPATTAPQGVPGAAANQPGAAPPGTAPTAASPSSLRRESVVNYEVDKTTRHVRNTVGTTRRLSAAVVVNFRNGKPLAAEELAQVAALAKEAMGFNQSRGDSINVANAPFSVEAMPPPAEVEAWKDPANLALAKDAGKALLAALAILYVILGVIRPLLRSVAAAPVYEAPAAEALPAEVPVDNGQRLVAAKQLAKSDPKVVAGVLKNWVSANE